MKLIKIVYHVKNKLAINKKIQDAFQLRFQVTQAR